MLELGWLYDLLGQIDEVGEVVLAHPYKTRLIAEAQIKTDRIDAQALAKLLRGDLIAQSHVPSAPTRARKHLLRQRLFWVRLRTMLRNRIHAILDRQHGMERPQLKNFFSRRGQTWLEGVQLPCAEDQPLLKQDLEVAELSRTEDQATGSCDRPKPECRGKALGEHSWHWSTL